MLVWPVTAFSLRGWELQMVPRLTPPLGTKDLPQTWEECPTQSTPKQNLFSELKLVCHFSMSDDAVECTGLFIKLPLLLPWIPGSFQRLTAPGFSYHYLNRLSQCRWTYLPSDMSCILKKMKITPVLIWGGVLGLFVCLGAFVWLFLRFWDRFKPYNHSS